MRRTITVVMFSAMVVFGFSARPVRAAEPAGLRVATFHADVTPPPGSFIYGLQRLETIEHPLLAKGIVLEDGRRRYVLCSVDYCLLSNGTHTMFRRKLAEAAGTDLACVAVQTTHVHTAPLVDQGVAEILEAIQDPPAYYDLALYETIADRLAAAVAASLNGLQPFDQVGMGQAKVERVASSRRVPDAAGTLHWRGSSSGKRAELRALPEGNIDPFLKTITLARDGKPLVRMHYYATHPQTFYRDGRASYDFVGMAREALQEKEDVFQVYFTGCAGDVAAGKYNDGTPEARQALYERLLAGMEAAVASTAWMPAERPEWRTAPVLLPPRSDAGQSAADRRAKLLDEKVQPFMRTWHARRLAFAQRADQPIELSLLRIGRVHIVHLPGEPMLEYQWYAQRLRPDDFVAVAGYGEGSPSYICTERAFTEGGYEPAASAVGPESEGSLKAAIRQLLGVE
ncbi:MAG: hypothetical protein RBS80_31400 [Thermoguttaceae bacterium]|jgi:hypothetical protein|nr:hypothetical protein [Thermoguttaceae bacterium]